MQQSSNFTHTLIGYFPPGTTKIPSIFEDNFGEKTIFKYEHPVYENNFKEKKVEMKVLLDNDNMLPIQYFPLIYNNVLYIIDSIPIIFDKLFEKTVLYNQNKTDISFDITRNGFTNLGLTSADIGYPWPTTYFNFGLFSPRLTNIEVYLTTGGWASYEIKRSNPYSQVGKLNIAAFPFYFKMPTTPITYNLLKHYTLHCTSRAVDTANFEYTNAYNVFCYASWDIINFVHHQMGPGALQLKNYTSAEDLEAYYLDDAFKDTGEVIIPFSNDYTKGSRKIINYSHFPFVYKNNLYNFIPLNYDVFKNFIPASFAQKNIKLPTSHPHISPNKIFDFSSGTKYVVEYDIVSASELKPYAISAFYTNEISKNLTFDMFPFLLFPENAMLAARIDGQPVPPNVAYDYEAVCYTVEEYNFTPNLYSSKTYLIKNTTSEIKISSISNSDYIYDIDGIGQVNNYPSSIFPVNVFPFYHNNTKIVVEQISDEYFIVLAEKKVVKPITNYSTIKVIGFTTGRYDILNNSGTGERIDIIDGYVPYSYFPFIYNKIQYSLVEEFTTVQTVIIKCSKLVSSIPITEINSFNQTTTSIAIQQNNQYKILNIVNGQIPVNEFPFIIHWSNAGMEEYTGIKYQVEFIPEKNFEVFSEKLVYPNETISGIFDTQTNVEVYKLTGFSRLFENANTINSLNLPFIYKNVFYKYYDYNPVTTTEDDFVNEIEIICRSDIEKIPFKTKEIYIKIYTQYNDTTGEMDAIEVIKNMDGYLDKSLFPLVYMQKKYYLTIIEAPTEIINKQINYNESLDLIPFIYQQNTILFNKELIGTKLIEGGLKLEKKYFPFYLNDLYYELIPVSQLFFKITSTNDVYFNENLDNVPLDFNVTKIYKLTGLVEDITTITKSDFPFISDNTLYKLILVDAQHFSYTNNIVIKYDEILNNIPFHYCNDSTIRIYKQNGISKEIKLENKTINKTEFPFIYNNTLYEISSIASANFSYNEEITIYCLYSLENVPLVINTDKIYVLENKLEINIIDGDISKTLFPFVWENKKYNLDEVKDEFFEYTSNKFLYATNTDIEIIFTDTTGEKIIFWPNGLGKNVTSNKELITNFPFIYNNVKYDIIITNIEKPSNEKIIHYVENQTHVIVKDFENLNTINVYNINLGNFTINNLNDGVDISFFPFMYYLTFYIVKQVNVIKFYCSDLQQFVKSSFVDKSSILVYKENIGSYVNIITYGSVISVHDFPFIYKSTLYELEKITDVFISYNKNLQYIDFPEAINGNITIYNESKNENITLEIINNQVPVLLFPFIYENKRYELIPISESKFKIISTQKIDYNINKTSVFFRFANDGEITVYYENGSVKNIVLINNEINISCFPFIYQNILYSLNPVNNDEYVYYKTITIPYYKGDTKIKIDFAVDGEIEIIKNNKKEILEIIDGNINIVYFPFIFQNIYYTVVEILGTSTTDIKIEKLPYLFSSNKVNINFTDLNSITVLNTNGSLEKINITNKQIEKSKFPFVYQNVKYEIEEVPNENHLYYSEVFLDCYAQDDTVDINFTSSKEIVIYTNDGKSNVLQIPNHTIHILSFPFIYENTKYSLNKLKINRDGYIIEYKNLNHLENYSLEEFTNLTIIEIINIDIFYIIKNSTQHAFIKIKNKGMEGVIKFKSNEVKYMLIFKEN